MNYVCHDIVYIICNVLLFWPRQIYVEIKIAHMYEFYFSPISIRVINFKFTDVKNEKKEIYHWRQYTWWDWDYLQENIKLTCRADDMYTTAG